MKFPVGLRVLVGFCSHFFFKFLFPALVSRSPLDCYTARLRRVGAGGVDLGVARKLFGSLLFLFLFWCGYRFPVGEYSASIFG